MSFHTFSSSSRTAFCYVRFCLSSYNLLEVPVFRCCFRHYLSPIICTLPSNNLLNLRTYKSPLHLWFHIWWYGNVKSKDILACKNFPFSGNLALYNNVSLPYKSLNSTSCLPGITVKEIKCTFHYITIYHAPEAVNHQI
jgi:hypothetical protein